MLLEVGWDEHFGIVQLGDVWRIVLRKYGEVYVWECRPETRNECLLSVMRYAWDEQYALTLQDAAYITQQIRREVPLFPPEPESYRDEYEDWFGPDDLPGCGWLAVALVIGCGCWVGIYFAVRAFL